MENVLDFLELQFRNGASYSTLNTSRSALSLLLSHPNDQNLGEDPRIKRFMKGVFRICPVFPKYKTTWDPHPVLDFLKSLYPLDGLSLSNLTYKLVGLLALATGHRVQTFSKMSLNNVHRKADGVEIFIDAVLKTSAPGKPQPCLFLPFFLECPELCVATTFLEYIERTRSIRSMEDEKILISFVKPYKYVTSQTVSRWIKLVLRKSGIDTSAFTAHSTRHSSTSSAKRRGVDIEHIRKVAGWTDTSNVFTRFYERPIVQSSNFANVVLLQ